MKNYVIAIDGPAASGKSSVAKLVAQELNYVYIDSGAMYRAVALYMLENGNIDDLDKIKITFDKQQNVFLNDINVTKEIRSSEVTKLVPKVAQASSVRAYLVKQQQEFAKNHNIVMDGRDIGTVVFKDAKVKIFQLASVDARAQRRYLEELAKNNKVELNEIKREIKSRDEQDINREIAPLKKAEDAIEVDTSDMSLEESVAIILEIIKERVNANE